jgi:hypothetical protein
LGLVHLLSSPFFSKKENSCWVLFALMSYSREQKKKWTLKYNP